MALVIKEGYVKYLFLKLYGGSLLVSLSFFYFLLKRVAKPYKNINLKFNCKPFINYCINSIRKRINSYMNFEKLI